MFDFTLSSHTDGSPVLTLTGILDINSVPVLRRELRRLIDAGEQQIIVDLDGLQYLDSSGLGVLVGVLSRLRERGGNLSIVVSGPTNRRVFEVTHLSSVFNLYDSLSSVPETF